MSARDFAVEMRRNFAEDITHLCTELTRELYATRGAVIKMKGTFALLFSDLP